LLLGANLDLVHRYNQARRRRPIDGGETLALGPLSKPFHLGLRVQRRDADAVRRGESKQPAVWTEARALSAKGGARQEPDDLVRGKIDDGVPFRTRMPEGEEWTFPRRESHARGLPLRLAQRLQAFPRCRVPHVDQPGGKVGACQEPTVAAEGHAVD